MKRFKCIVEYDGENYAGFQTQQNANTVQDELEKALSNLLQEKIKITASGRTDSGVSAVGQVIHFDSNTTIPPEKLPFAIKILLPNDISITKCDIANNDFHARFSAKSKTYSYKICLTKVNRPLFKKYYQYPFDIDFSLLQAAFDKIKGKHDFRAFMASGSDVINFEREIYDIKYVMEESNSSSQNCFKIYITANGFLYNMVRIIVGLCLDIARGKLALDNIDTMFQTGDRSFGGHTAPPEPLCLEEVFY